jgi:hypothetical protein
MWSSRSLPTFQRAFLPPSSGRMMEAARTSETSVNFYQTTRRYNPEDGLISIVVITVRDQPLKL